MNRARPRVVLRRHRLCDARRFFEILSSPQFRYFPVTVKSVKEEREFLRQNRRMWQEKTALNFAILYRGQLVGAVGLRVDPAFPHVAAAGYFLDVAYWGRGIASEALRQLEQVAAQTLGIVRIELTIALANRPSIAVARRCGYRKEGVLRSRLMFRGKYFDAVLFAKLLESAPSLRKKGAVPLGHLRMAVPQIRYRRGTKR